MSTPSSDVGPRHRGPMIPADHPSLNLPPQPERAGWGHRAGAGLIDATITVAPGLLLDDRMIGGPDSLLPVAWMAGTWFLNMVVLASRNGGRSVGKLIAGTWVESEHGREPYTFAVALMRDVICRLVYLIPVFVVVDALMPLGPRRQSLRDRMVDTVVLRRPDDRSRSAPLALATLLAVAALVGVGYATGIFESE